MNCFPHVWKSSSKDVMIVRRVICVFLCLCFLGLPVKAAEREKLVALTFDDGPSGRYTRALLEGMAQRDIKATFFLCGYRMEQYPDLVEKILDNGHEIGLHGYSHKSMETMCLQEIRKELKKTSALLPKSSPAVFLRPPGGICSRTVLAAAQEQGLALLLWSVDPRDWATNDARAVEASVLETVRDGDVILLHDMTDSSVTAALSIMDKLQAQGFRFVTVSELAKARGITPEPGRRYAQFR